MLSFIIPAHNEERLLGRTLDAINHGAVELGQPFEVIVVNDASTDKTAEVASAHGATVVPVELRKISAVRNAGARRASGDVFVFVDADTVVPAPTLAAAWRAVRSGAMACGAVVRFDEPVAPWASMMTSLWNCGSRLGRWAAGCFIFVRRSAFEAIGGFDESYYAGEEIGLSERLKKQGPLVILARPVYTSGRKTKSHSLREVCRIMGTMLWHGPEWWQRREGLDYWYERRDGG